jgi:putative PIN family toxin of toxin-antitoxin system
MKAGTEKVRVVFDTNVLVSIFGFPGGRLDALWTIVLEGSVTLALSEFILEEFSRNLASKAGLSSHEVAQAVDALRRRAEVVSPTQQLKVIRTPDADNRILECAVEAGAQVLVTGNFRHIRPLGKFQGIVILTPREFLDRYFPDL